MTFRVMEGDAAARGRLAWSRLADPSALGMAVGWYAAPIGFLGPLLVDRNRLGGSALVWALIALAGQGALLAGLVAGRRLLPDGMNARTRPWATLATFLLAVTLRGIVIGTLVFVGGYAPSLELRYRVVGSVPLIGGALVVSALLVVAGGQHRRLVAELQSRRRDLERLDASMLGRLAEIREGLLTSVRTSLDPGLAELTAALDAAAAGSSPSGSVERLRVFVDDVRDLSRTLLLDPESLHVVDPLDGAPTPAAVRWPSRLPLRRAIWPTTQGVLIALAATGSATRDLPPFEALEFVLALGVVTFASMWVVRALLGGLRPSFGVALVVAFVIGGLFTWGSVLVVSTLVAAPRLVASAGLMVGAGVALFCALHVAVDLNRAALEAELASTVRRLEESVSALRQHTWVARRRLSLLLHGSVQSAVNVAIIRLGSMGSPDPGTVDAIRRDLAAAMAGLTSVRASAPSLTATLDDIAVTWQGVCEVTWSISDGARAVLDSDADCCECSAEVVREAVHNAIVHGKATRVVVQLARRGDRLGVRVEDDGIGCSGAARAGLGTRMFDELCVHWERQSNGAGTSLDAELSLA